MITDEPIVNDTVYTFDPEEFTWREDLKIALDELPLKIADINQFYNYYEGRHPKVWLTDRIRDMFKSLSEKFIENWCMTVVDTPLHRMRVTGWIAGEPEPGEEPEQVDAALDIFKDNDLVIGQSDLYRQARIAGEAFLFVWRDENKKSGVDLSINDARLVWWPPGAHRVNPDRVVKLWLDDREQRWRATVYYSHEYVRLRGPRLNAMRTLPQVRYFEPDPDDPGGLHGFDRVPVIRFARQAKRMSALDPVTPIQDMINKLKANKMVVAEWLAFRPLAILTRQTIDDDALKMRPNRALVLDPGGSEDGEAPTQVWQGEASDLSNYDDSLAEEVHKIFTFGYLPRHILVDTGSPVSGDAIEADEGPFTEMLEDSLRTYGASWVDVFELLGIEAQPQWHSVAVRSDEAESVTVNNFKLAGVDLGMALVKYAGWSQQEVNALEKKLEARAEQQQAQQQAAVEAQAKLVQASGGGSKPPVNANVTPRRDAARDAKG